MHCYRHFSLHSVLRVTFYDGQFYVSLSFYLFLRAPSSGLLRYSDLIVSFFLLFFIGTLHFVSSSCYSVIAGVKPQCVSLLLCIPYRVNFLVEVPQATECSYSRVAVVTGGIAFSLPFIQILHTVGQKTI